MDTQTKLRTVSISITLSQIAEGLRKLSRSEIETLELLLDKKAMKVIKKSLDQAQHGKWRELGS